MVTFSYYTGDFESKKPNLSLAVVIIIVSAVLENLSEPFYVRILISRDFKHKAYAEGLSILAKSLSIYFLLRLQWDIMAYAIA